MDSAELGDSDVHLGFIYKLDQELGAHRFALNWSVVVSLVKTLVNRVESAFSLDSGCDSGVFSTKICQGQLKPDHSGGDIAKLASDRASF